VHLSGRSPSGSIKVSTTGKQAKAGRWQHVFATYDGSGKAAGITLYVDGVKVPTKVNSDRLTGSIRTKAPLRIGSRTGGIVLEDAQVQDVRIYGRELSADEIVSLHAFTPLHHYLRLEPEQRTKIHNGTVHRHSASAQCIGTGWPQWTARISSFPKPWPAWKSNEVSFKRAVQPP